MPRGEPRDRSRQGSARRRSGWYVLLGLLVSAALLWWALRDVAPAELVAHLQGVRPSLFVAAVLTVTATYPLRVVRWRYLLRFEGAALGFLPLWHATAIGLMANNLLPARVGELARAYAAKRLTGIAFVTAFASIAVERILDGMALVAILAAAVWIGGFDPDTTVGGVRLSELTTASAGLFTLLLLAAVLLVHRPGPALRLARSLLSRLMPRRRAERVSETLAMMLSGLDALRNPRLFLLSAAWSLVIWLVSALSFWLGLRAFALETPGAAALLLQSLVAFGVAIPSSPGFFGPFEAVCRLVLGLYGIPAGPAVSYSVGMHLGGFFPIVGLGLWSLGRSRLRWAELRRLDGEEAETVTG